MLNGLKLWNFLVSAAVPEQIPGYMFVLKTCQRTLVLTFDHPTYEHFSFSNQQPLAGEEAYIFLLETICGLKSKLIGENEIVGQFKEAYKIYSQATLRDTRLQRILEKLFKDAKEIRTEYLIGISQKTYASLARKHFIQRAKASHIVVIGSGALAEDLINQFKKKALVSICARNTEKVNELAKAHQLNVIPWEDRSTLVHQPFLANTIGHESVIFDEKFFQAWSDLQKHRLFVDLGSPSVIETSLTLSEGVVRLNDIFNEGAIVEDHKQQQINLAREAMYAMAQKRKSLFEQKLLTPQMSADVRYL
jgi:glutamyl-tRNA reductase